MRLRSALLAAAMMAVAAVRLPAQQIHLGDASSQATTNKPQHVMLLDDAATVTAGSSQELELRFRVGAGLHINSHSPKDELLVPTTLTLEAQPGVQVGWAEFPAGHPFRLNIGEGETLDVYQDEFRVRVSISAAKGQYTLRGSLHYQACDTASCFPPRTLPVTLVLTAR